jgi:serine protease Do
MKKLNHFLPYFLLLLILVSCASVYNSYNYLFEKVKNQSVLLVSDNKIYCSGVIIAKDYVLTADHCIKLGPNEGNVRFYDKSERAFTVVKAGNFENSPDLALLSVLTKENPAKLGKEPLVGDLVAAVGAAYRLGWTFTFGVVSAVNQELIDEYTGQSNGKFLQHDAQISPGSSGGGLYNIYGELVGINVRAGAGISFAVPLDQIRDFLKDAIPEKR